MLEKPSSYELSGIPPSHCVNTFTFSQLSFVHQKLEMVSLSLRVQIWISS